MERSPGSLRAQSVSPSSRHLAGPGIPNFGFIGTLPCVMLIDGAGACGQGRLDRNGGRKEFRRRCSMVISPSSSRGRTGTCRVNAIVSIVLCLSVVPVLRKRR